MTKRNSNNNNNMSLLHKLVDEHQISRGITISKVMRLANASEG